MKTEAEKEYEKAYNSVDGKRNMHCFVRMVISIFFMVMLMMGITMLALLRGATLDQCVSVELPLSVLSLLMMLGFFALKSMVEFPRPIHPQDGSDDCC